MSHLLLDFDRLIVSDKRYIYCLDPLTGNIPVAQSAKKATAWQRKLAGFRARPNFADRDRTSSRSGCRGRPRLSWGDNLTAYRLCAATGNPPVVPR